jgi:SAM-dependent methyltransferase
MSTLIHGKLISADEYAAAYGDGDGFEAVCIEGRQQCNEAFLIRERPRKILEVGSGPYLLCARPALTQLTFEHWTIVEPAAAYAELARSATALDPRFDIVESYLEAAADALHARNGEGYNCAVVSSIVHETTDPLGLLGATERLLAPGGKVVISTPNAYSFHRLLAVEGGLMDTPHALSARDLKFGHPKVFDPRSLAELAAKAGLVDIEGGGYLFKPFTNAQMELLSPALTKEVWQGMITLGRQFPDHAAEIYVMCAKR